MTENKFFALNASTPEGRVWDVVSFTVTGDTVRIVGADTAESFPERISTVTVEAARAEWKRLIAAGYRIAAV